MGFIWTEKHKYNTKNVTAILRLLAPKVYLLSLLVHIHFFTPTTMSTEQDALLFEKTDNSEYHFFFTLLRFAIIKNEETKSLCEFVFFVPFATRHVTIFIFYPLYFCTLLGKWKLTAHFAPHCAKSWSNTPPTLILKQNCHASIFWPEEEIKYTKKKRKYISENLNGYVVLVV